MKRSQSNEKGVFHWCWCILTLAMFSPNVHTYIHTYIYIHACLFVGVNFDSLATGNQFWIKRIQVVFHYWMQVRTQGLWNRISDRLNVRWQIDWANEDQAKTLNSIAHPYDQPAFSPLDPTVDMASPLALAICMFIGGNFDGLATGKWFRIEKR